MLQCSVSQSSVLYAAVAFLGEGLTHHKACAFAPRTLHFDRAVVVFDNAIAIPVLFSNNALHLNAQLI